MRPVISNIGAPTYEITKYLNKLLTSLSKSDYDILNTEDLIREGLEKKQFQLDIEGFLLT